MLRVIWSRQPTSGTVDAPVSATAGSSSASRRRGGVFEKLLPRAITAPRLARHALAEWVGADLSRWELQRAKLAVSELVTNAVTHGEGGAVLRAALDHRRLRVEVIDQGSGFVHQVDRVHLEQTSGYGLAIVDEVTSRWGACEGTTRVWFELDR